MSDGIKVGGIRVAGIEGPNDWVEGCKEMLTRFRRAGGKPKERPEAVQEIVDRIHHAWDYSDYLALENYLQELEASDDEA